MPLKLEYLSSGNTFLSRIDNGVETQPHGFFPDSGANLLPNNLIKIFRQNGADQKTFDWREVNTIIGKSGVIAKPTSQVAFYKMLFEEFLIASVGGGGGGTQDVNVISTTPALALEATLQLNKDSVDEVKTSVDTVKISVDEVTTAVEAVEEKLCIEENRLFIDLNNPSGASILPYPRGILQITISSQAGSNAYAVNVTANTISEFISAINSVQSELLFSEKDTTQLFVDPLNNTGFGALNSDSIQFFTNSPGFSNYSKQLANLNVLITKNKTQALIIENQAVIISELGDKSTETKQDAIINSLSNLADLLTGPSNSSTPMPTATQADTVGNEYMMITFRALQNTTIILKNLDLLSLTNDSGMMCIYINPTINNAAGITYVPVPGSAFLEQGNIVTGSPTPQQRTGGGDLKYCATIQRNSSKYIQQINQTYTLNTGDVVFIGIAPLQNGLDATMIASYLQK